MVGDWKCWYVRKGGGHWATVRMNGDVPVIATAFATYHWPELMHYIDGVMWEYDNSPCPSLFPSNEIEIP